MSLISKPFSKIAHTVAAEKIKRDDGMEYTRITNSPEFDSKSNGFSAEHNIIKTALQVGDRIYNPATGRMQEIKNITSTGPTVGAAQLPFLGGIGAGLGLGGNAMASSVSGTSSLLKALLAILAGAGGSIGAAAATAPISESQLGQAAMLGAMGAGGVGGSYLMRRILDRFKRKGTTREEGEPSVIVNR